MKTRPPLSLDRKIELFGQRGWSPVRWAHHPEVVRKAIREARMVPVMKGCFRNSQRLMLSQHVVPFRYFEGIVQGETCFAIEHAWLALEDYTVVDLTLDPRPIVVVAYEYSLYEVCQRVASTSEFGPVSSTLLALANQCAMLGIDPKGLSADEMEAAVKAKWDQYRQLKATYKPDKEDS